MSLSDLAKTEIKLPSFRRKPRQDAPERPERPRARKPPDYHRSFRRTTAPRGVTGLDIEPGEVVAAQAKLEGGAITVERAASGVIPHNFVRDGEVSDGDALASWLKGFFSENNFPRTVRVGATSHRAVMRTIDLPPLTDAGDIARRSGSRRPSTSPCRPSAWCSTTR